MAFTYPKNKILIVIFFLVLFATLALIVLFKVKTSSTNSAKSPTEISLSDAMVGKRADLDIGIRKTVSPEDGTVFYFLDAVLAEDLGIDESNGEAFGSFYFVNDPGQNLVNFHIKNTLDNFYIGKFTDNFSGNSRWKFDSPGNLLSLGIVGTRVEIRGKFNPKVSADIEKVNKTDEVFTSIQNSNGGGVNITENYFFNAFSIGFIE